MRAPRRETGQTTVMTLGIALVCFAVCGLAVDGTKAFLMRRTLQNAADAASLAAASDLDRDAYYSSGGRRVLLDAVAARRTAERYLSMRGISGRTEVRATRRGVTVAVRAATTTTFLALVGIDEVPVAAEARAAPFAGSP